MASTSSPLAPNGVPLVDVAAFERNVRQEYLFAAIGRELQAGNPVEALRYWRELDESLREYGQDRRDGASGY